MQWRRLAIGTPAVAAVVVAYILLLRSSDRVLDVAERTHRSVAIWLVAGAVVALLGAVVAPQRWRDTAERVARHPATAPALMATSICLCVTPAITTWLHGSWGYSKIAGIIPWSDAQAYHAGGAQLLDDDSLAPFNMRRPLNAGFSAIRLAATGGDFWLAMLLQAAIVGASAWVLLRIVGRHFGVAASLVAASLLWTYVLPSLDVTLSEALGVSLGCLAAAALLEGTITGSPWLLLAGLSTLSLALNVRAGALLVLPCLFVWFVVATVRRRGRRWQRVALAAVAVFSGFVVSSALNGAFGTDAGAANGNLAYVLYGIAHGGTGWASYREELPDEMFSSEAERVDAVYDAAFAEIRRHPGNFVNGIRKGFDAYVEAGVFGFVDAQPMKRLAVPLMFVGLLGSLAVETYRRVGLMLLVVIVGFFASVPFVFEDGGYRVFAATIPILVLAPAVAVVVLRRALAGVTANHRAAPVERPQIEKPPLRFAGAACLAAFVVLGVGPFVAVLLHSKPDVAAPACAQDRVPVVMEVGPDTPHVVVLPEGETSTDLGELTAAKFHQDPSYGRNEIASELSKVRPGSVLVLGYNLVAEGMSPMVVAPADQVPSAQQLVSFCGRLTDDSLARRYSFMYTDRLEVVR